MDTEKIRTTKTLLDTPNDALTDEEKDVVNWHSECVGRRNDTLERENGKIVEECSILCGGMEDAPIPNYGWIRPVRHLCYAIEAINIEYGKYGIATVLEQSKEKFGTLRFYTETSIVPTGTVGAVVKSIEWILSKLDRVDYGRTVVTDRESYKTVEWNEIAKEQFDARKDQFGNDIVGKDIEVVGSREEARPLPRHEDVRFFVKENGKFYVSTLVQHAPKAHVEYRKHFFLKAVRDLVFDVSFGLSRLRRKSKVQSVMLQFVDDLVYKLVRQAEEECYNLCQDCGSPIGQKGSPRCETDGWIAYVCEECAMVRGGKYHKGGKTFVEGEEVVKGDAK